MVVRVIALTILAMSFGTALSASGTPDLSDVDPATLRRYIGHFVRVTGRMSVTGTYGPSIDTRQAKIYLLPSAYDSVDASLEKLSVVGMGTLYYQPGLRLAPGFFFFGDDRTVHYASPWPHKPSNQSMQLTALPGTVLPLVHE